MEDAGIGPSHIHEWRLIDERSDPAKIEYIPQPGAPGYGATISHGTIRRWYCTRCRTIEETTE